MISFTLGDMHVLGATMPTKLVKPLAAIATFLHPTIGADARIAPGASYDSCILCSLLVREFLQRLGFVDARCTSVCAIAGAYQGDKILHTLGIGDPEGKGGRKMIDGRARWDGHMVVTTQGWLIDTTLYRACDRPAWRGHMPKMAAVQLQPGVHDEKLFGLTPLTTIEVDDVDGYYFGLTWLDNPTNQTWRNGPDAGRPLRRRRWVDAMLAAFPRATR